MEDKQSINYELIITEKDRNMCSKIDPLGQCTPTDCMTCYNAKVKIVREDGVVMRDDGDKNSSYEENYTYLKYKWNNNPYQFLEEFFNFKFTRLQKIMFKLLKK